MNFDPFPWQKKAISKGIFEYQNLVLCWPTSSGKTYILIETMLRAAVQGKRSVLILPGVDSVKEKADILWKRYTAEYSSVDIEVAYICQGNKFFKSKKRRKPPIQECEIIVATYESLDKLLRNEKHLKGETHFRNIDIIAADEIHKIYNEKRGDTADKVVTLLRYLNPNAQVLFSIATHSGVQELAKWVKGNPLFEDRRPTEVAIFIYCLSTKSFSSVRYEVPCFLAEIQAECEVEFYTQLKKAVESCRGRCLIFHGTRKKTVSHALEYLAYKNPSGSLEGDLLSKLIWARTGYLNAGLSKKAREVVIDAYKSGDINTLHTTTLIAESFDSDTNMVIVSDLKLAGNEIDPADLEQMLGRIRKPFHANKDYPFGIGIILAQNEEQVSRVLNILHSSTDFSSKLEIYDSFLDQVLSLLKYYNWEETEHILEQTFFAFLKKEKFITYICAAKQDLRTIGFVDEHDRLTSQAKAAVQYFIPVYIARKLISMKHEFYGPDIIKSLETICGVFAECRFERFGRTPSTDGSHRGLYEEGISEIRTKSRFMTKEQLLTLLLLHVHTLTYKEIKQVLRLGSYDFSLLMRQAGRYIGFISRIAENRKINLLKLSFDFGIPPQYAKILSSRFPKRNEYHIKFRKLVREFLDKGRFEPNLIQIYKRLKREDEVVWNAFFTYTEHCWDFEESEGIALNEEELSNIKEYLKEKKLLVKNLRDSDPLTQGSTNCIEAFDEDFAIRIYPGVIPDYSLPMKRFYRRLGLLPGIKFKAIGDEKRAQNLSRRILDLVIKSRKMLSPEECLDREPDERDYEAYEEYGEGDDYEGYFL